MSLSQEEQKKAVGYGYWPLYRFDPRLKEQGKNPFMLDSKEPVGDFREFLMGEVRYASLTRTFPDRAENLFQQAEEDMKERFEVYKRLASPEAKSGVAWSTTEIRVAFSGSAQPAVRAFFEHVPPCY